MKLAAALLCIGVVAFAFAIAMYLTGARVDATSWLDVPAAVCGWWIMVGVPLSVVAINMLLREPSVRERRAGRVVLGGAVMLFCGWMATMVFVFTATSG